MNENPEQKKEKQSRGSQAAIGLGYQLLATGLVCIGGGYYMDQRSGGGHAWTIGGVFAAFVLGGYEVWKLVKLLEREDAEKTDGKK